MIFGTTQKLKFQKLKHRLKIPFWQTVGVLEALWVITYSNAPDGDIGKLSNEEIAAALEWDGDPDLLVSALIDCRWLDEAPAPYRLLIHDWPTHCAASHKSNYKRWHKRFAHEAIAANGSMKHDPKESPSCNPKDDPKEHLLTYPNLAKPSPSSPSQPAAPATVSVSHIADTNPPADGGDDDDDFAGDFSNGWKAAESRLASLGATRWRETIADAKGNGCTPGHVMELLAHAKAHGYPVGSVVYRVSRARMSLPVADGWPPKPPDQAAAAQRKRSQESAEEQAHRSEAAKSKAAALERERRFGPELDAMDPGEVSEICKSNPAMAKLCRKGEKSPLLREWLLQQLERRVST